MKKTLVMGIGNEARGDDLAGLAVARSLRLGGLWECEVAESDGDVAALLQAFKGRTQVILVDACYSGVPPGTLHRFDAHAQRLPASLGAGSTHALGLADAIELARTLGELPPAVVVYAIEGLSYRPGDTLSPPVQRAVQVLERRIRAEIQAQAASLPAPGEPPIPSG